MDLSDFFKPFYCKFELKKRVCWHFIVEAMKISVDGKFPNVMSWVCTDFLGVCFSCGWIEPSSWVIIFKKKNFCIKGSLGMGEECGNLMHCYVVILSTQCILTLYIVIRLFLWLHSLVLPFYFYFWVALY